MSLAYRRAEDGDRRFVVDSWIDSYRTAHAAGMIQMSDWRGVMSDQVAKVLARPGVEVWVAYHPGETDHRTDLYGWIAAEQHDGPLVHYVYVKQAYRRLGVARGLCRAAGLDPGEPFAYTCKTAIVSKLPIPRAKWTPLAARFTKINPEETR